RDDTAPEAERAGEALGQRERHIGAEHVERAVGEVNDTRDAKDDRKARGDQEQRRRAGKTGQELDNIKGHKWSGFDFSPPLPARGEREKWRQFFGRIFSTSASLGR